MVSKRPADSNDPGPPERRILGCIAGGASLGPDRPDSAAGGLTAVIFRGFSGDCWCVVYSDSRFLPAPNGHLGTPNALIWAGKYRLREPGFADEFRAYVCGVERHQRSDPLCEIARGALRAGLRGRVLQRGLSRDRDLPART